MAVVRRRQGQLDGVARLGGQAFDLHADAVGTVARGLVALRAPAGVEAVAQGLARFRDRRSPGDSGPRR